MPSLPSHNVSSATATRELDGTLTAPKVICSFELWLVAEADELALIATQANVIVLDRIHLCSSKRLGCVIMDALAYVG